MPISSPRLSGIDDRKPTVRSTRRDLKQSIAHLVWSLTGETGELEQYEKSAKKLLDWKEFSSCSSHQMMRNVDLPHCGSNWISRRSERNTFPTGTLSLFQHFISTTRILRVRDLLTYCAGKNVGSDVWLFMPAIWSKLFKMFPLLRNDGTHPHVKTRESPPSLICVSTHCTHDLSLLTSRIITFSPPSPSRPSLLPGEHPTHTDAHAHKHVRAH